MTETNVFALSQPGSFIDPLTEVLRDGARALLAQAVEAEVATLLRASCDSLIAVLTGLRRQTGGLSVETAVVSPYPGAICG